MQVPKRNNLKSLLTNPVELYSYNHFKNYTSSFVYCETIMPGHIIIPIKGGIFLLNEYIHTFQERVVDII